MSITDAEAIQKLNKLARTNAKPQTRQPSEDEEALQKLSALARKNTVEQIQQEAARNNSVPPSVQTETAVEHGGKGGSFAEPNFAQRVGKTVAGAAESSASSFVNIGGFLAEAFAQGNNRYAPMIAKMMGQTTQDVLDLNRREGTAAKKQLEETADKLAAKSEQTIKEAQFGAGKVGKTLIEAGVAGTQMLGDAAANLVAPGAGLAVMGARVFGMAAQEQRLKGGDEAEQMLAGIKSAAIEVLTERLGGFYGSSKLGQLVDEAVGKIGRAKLKALVKLGTNAGVEAIEELISGIANPIADRLLDLDGQRGAKERPSQYIDWRGSFHDALIGGILGFVGGGTQVIRESTASKKAAKDSIRPKPDQTNDAAEAARGALNPSQPAPVTEQTEQPTTPVQPAPQTQTEDERLMELYRQEYAPKTEETAPVETQNLPNPLTERFGGMSNESILNDNTVTVARPFGNNSSSFATVLVGTDGAVRISYEKSEADAQRIADNYQAMLGHGMEVVNTAQEGSIQQAITNIERARNAERVEYAESEFGSLDAFNAEAADAEMRERQRLATMEQTEPVEDGATVSPESSVGAAERGFSERDTTVSQFATNTMQRTMSPEQYNDPDLTSDARSEQTIAHNADTVQAASRTFTALKNEGGYMAVLDYLFEREAFTVVDAELAKLAVDEIQAKIEAGDYEYDLTALERGENPNAAYDELAYIANELNYMLMKQNRRAGQILQLTGTWTSQATPQSTLDEVRTEIDSNEDMSDAEKAAKYKVAAEWISKINAIKPKSRNANADLKAVIKDIADSRGVNRRMISHKKRAKLADRLIDHALDRLDFMELQQLALSSAKASVYDSTDRANFGQRLKTAQVLFLLSRPTTPNKNITGNTVMSAIDAISMNGATLADILLSKKTGTRSVAADKWIFSKEARQGMSHAANRSIAEVLLDVDMGSSGRYGGAKRTNKMNGNAVERVFSIWERNNAVLMVTTDEAYKGAVKGGTEAGLRRLNEEGKAVLTDEYIAEYADKLAKERTFQQYSVIADTITRIHDALNVIGVGKTGKTIGRTGIEVKAFGVGDIVAPFTRVAGNLVSSAVDYSALNAVKGFAEMSRILYDTSKGKSVSPEQQAKAVKDFSRGVNGTALIALCYIIASGGFLRRADDEDDKDVAALNAAEGLAGTQINFDAMMRYFSGESGEWMQGDHLWDISSIEPLNTLLAIGTVAAGWEDEDTFGGKIVDALDAFLESAVELPILQFIDGVVDSVTYGDTLAQALGNEFTSSAVNMVTPNFVRGLASGTDEYYRDTYSGDTALQNYFDAFKAGNPITRKSLPIKQTPFGEEKKYSGTEVQHFLNQMFNPIGVNTYTQSGLSAEMQRVREATKRVDYYPDKTAPKKISIKNTEYPLSYSERTQYQETAGDYYMRKGDEISSASGWSSLSPFEKATVLSTIRSASEAYAKTEYAQKNGLTYTGGGSISKVEKYIELAKRGGSALSDQLIYENATSGYSTNADRVDAAVEAGVDEETVLDNLGTDKGIGKGYTAYKSSNGYSSKVDLLDYVDIYDYRFNRAKGTDENGDGKTDSGSVKENVRDYIKSRYPKLSDAEISAIMVSLGYKD